MIAQTANVPAPEAEEIARRVLKGWQEDKPLPPPASPRRIAWALATVSGFAVLGALALIAGLLWAVF